MWYKYIGKEYSWITKGGYYKAVSITNKKIIIVDDFLDQNYINKKDFILIGTDEDMKKELIGE